MPIVVSVQKVVSVEVNGACCQGLDAWFTTNSVKFLDKVVGTQPGAPNAAYWGKFHIKFCPFCGAQLSIKKQWEGG